MFEFMEHCLICSSANHLLIGDVDLAWECWHCSARYWIDDSSRLEHQVFHGVGLAEAEKDLVNNHGTRLPKFAMNYGEGV